MIRINLLPTRRERNAVTLKVGMPSRVLLSLAAVVVVLVAEGLTWYGLDAKRDALQKEKLTAERELVVLRRQVLEVDDFEKDKKLYQNRIDVIQRLKKDQRGPVRLLDRISYELPDGVWLTQLSQSGPGISLEGMALSNDALVQYISRLKQSKLFVDVQLMESRQTTESSTPVYKFQMTFNINMDMI